MGKHQEDNGLIVLWNGVPPSVTQSAVSGCHCLSCWCSYGTAAPLVASASVALPGSGKGLARGPGPLLSDLHRAVLVRPSRELISVRTTLPAWGHGHSSETEAVNPTQRDRLLELRWRSGFHYNTGVGQRRRGIEIWIADKRIEENKEIYQ